jgi:S-DNA-T family DNA segregation ATPase FtsK/SpoIIIE
LSFGRALKTPQTLWLAGGALIALAITVALTAPLLVDGFEALLRTFGVGLALLAVGIAVDTRIALRRPQVDQRLLRLIAGSHLLGLFAFGAAALYEPEWELGDVLFREVSAGGNLGRLLIGNPLAVLGWLAAGFGGLGLVWPRGARGAWQAACAAGRFVESLHIPQNAWEAMRSFFASLVPKTEEENEKLLAEPYVPQWDEEWAETPPLPEPEEEQTPVEATPEDGEPIFLTSEPVTEQGPYQRELPMGRPAGHGWELPPYDLLAEAADVEIRPVDNEARSQLIVETLASFGVDARVVSINQGPTVTQFGVEPGWETKTRAVPVRDERGKQVFDANGRPAMRTEVVSRTRVRVNKITALANDLALALAAPTIRIEAPVPGKPIIGIEVPNTTTSLVAIRSVIESTAFQKANLRTKLAMALGKGVSGEPIAADLAKMPHLLIAGATGSGKSVCINSIVASLLLHNTPEDLRLVLVDPKRVEMATFAHIPHLAFSKIITDPEEIVGTLQAIIHEMDSRYRRFAEVGVRNIEAYNKSPRASHKLPYWVVIVDELADLMMAAPYEVERQICRLAQLARATGIHLVVATQRPSVDVITGLIKANFPTRIAFAVSSQVDSRTIIDGAGAEKLLGRGDMLFMPTDASKPKRIQGSYVSDTEIEKIVAWWHNDRFRHLVPDKMDHLLEEAEGEEQDKGSEEDPLFEAARDLARLHSRLSTSLLQRRLHIGYPRAARLVDLLEEAGIVGPAEAGHSREVLEPGDGSYDFEEDEAGRFA